MFDAENTVNKVVEDFKENENIESTPETPETPNTHTKRILAPLPLITLQRKRKLLMNASKIYFVNHQKQLVI